MNKIPYQGHFSKYMSTLTLDEKEIILEEIQDRLREVVLDFAGPYIAERGISVDDPEYDAMEQQVLQDLYESAALHIRRAL